MSELVQLNNFVAVDADDVMSMILDKQQKLVRVTMRDGNQFVRRIRPSDFAHYANPTRNKHRGQEQAPVMTEDETMHLIHNRLLRAVNNARTQRQVEKDFLPATPRIEITMDGIDGEVVQKTLAPAPLLTGDAAIRERLLAQGAVR